MALSKSIPNTTISAKKNNLIIANLIPKSSSQEPYLHTECMSMSSLLKYSNRDDWYCFEQCCPHCGTPPFGHLQLMRFRDCNRKLHTAFPAGNTDRIPSVLLFKQQKWLLLMSSIPFLYFSHWNSWEADSTFIVWEGEWVRGKYRMPSILQKKKKNF